MKSSQDILDKIKLDQIKPIPRWHFLLRNKFIWGLSVLTIAVGGLAFSVVIFLIREGDWETYEYTQTSLAGHIILSLPYLWLVTFILLLLISVYNVKHTKRGYKFSGYVLVGGSIVASLLLGGIMYASGMGDRLDLILSNRVSYYNNIVRHRHDMWMRPTEGLIAGVVMGNENDGVISIIDLNGKTWLVKTNSNTLIKPRMIINTSSLIRIFGKTDMKNHIINATIIHSGPGSKRMNMMRPGMMKKR